MRTDGQTDRHDEANSHFLEFYEHVKKRAKNLQYLTLLVIVFTILLFDEIMRCNRPLSQFTVNVASRTIKCRMSQVFVCIYMYASVCIDVCVKGALRL